VKKILITHFPGLDNYGTGMMGLVLTQYLMDHFGSDLEIHADFPRDETIDVVRGELDGSVVFKRFAPSSSKPTLTRMQKMIAQGFEFLTARSLREYDLKIVLGGDDLSEYYGSILKELLYMWRSHFVCPILLLGQTIGPFRKRLNRFFIKRVLPSLHVVVRDSWCHSYLRDEMGIKSIIQGADLAFCDLPRQSDSIIEKDVLQKYGLEKNEYCTLIISGLQKNGYYCKDQSVYLGAWKQLLEKLSGITALANKKFCLLAHTFGWYGDEKEYCESLYKTLPDTLKEKIVLVTDKILPLKARFILGNGLFTITGRMHASVSSFQMGTPAIVLSYSQKYDGVIGERLGRNDLILDANEEALWTTGKIVDLIEDKTKYVLNNYDQLKTEIMEKAAIQKSMAIQSLDIVSSLLNKGIRQI